jgi:hypothetical protein
MAGQFTRLQKTYRIASTNVNPDTTKNEIPQYRGVTFAGENEVQLPTADNQVPAGIVFNDERIDDPRRDGGSQAGRNIAVALEGIASIELSGTVAVGDRIILATGGKAKGASSLALGTKANVVGFAEKGGVAGDVIPVRMSYHVIEI